MSTDPIAAIRLGDRVVGPGYPALIVAELSANHNGSLDRALATVRAAAEAGVDAIKLQTYTADTLTIDCATADFQVSSGPWQGRTLHDLYAEAHTPWAWHGPLFSEAQRHGLAIFSTPFDATAVSYLQALGAPAYKIASFELVDDDLLRLVAGTGKPVILSTGMATVEEVAHAVDVLEQAGCHQRMLLRCTSSYPAPDEEMHLEALELLAHIGRCPVGLSDHSMGIVAPVVAVTLGASMIEKHFTLSRADGGVDSHFSAEPAEMRELVTAVRRAEAMRGRAVLGSGVADGGNTMFRRSLYVVKDIGPGEPLTRDNVRSIRPGYGLSPRYLDLILGRRASRGLQRGARLTWADVSFADSASRET